MSDIESHKCGPGYYRPWGIVQIECIACPEGTFNEHYGRNKLSQCQPCIAGRVCKVEGLTSPELIKDRVENCTKGFHIMNF